MSQPGRRLVALVSLGLTLTLGLAGPASAAEPIITVATGGRPTGVAVAADGSTAYVSNPGSSTIDVIDLRQRQLVGSISMAGGVQPPVVNASGTRLYASTEADGYLNVIDTASRSIITRVRVGRQPSTPVMSADGTRIFIANRGSDDVSIVETAGYNVIATVRVGDQPLRPVQGTGSQYEPLGNLLFVTCAGDGTLMTIDLTTNQVVAKATVGPAPTAPSVSPALGVISDEVYAASTTKGTIVALSQSSDGRASTGTVGRRPTTPVTSVDGSTLFVANTDSDSVSVLTNDESPLALTTTIRVGAGPTHPLLSPNGGILFVPNSGGQSVTIVDTATLRVRGSYLVEQGPVAPALTPDARTLIIPNARGRSVSVIDLTQAALPFAPPKARVTPKSGGTAVVTWPASNQAGVTGYVATASPGGRSCSTSAPRCAITGLTPGKAYRVSVQATNAYGAGAPTTTPRFRVPRS